MELTIECKQRPTGSKPNGLRREGLLPAVLYGHKGTESLSLVMEAKAAEILLRSASINNTLVQVKVPELSWQGQALIREVQTHPWRGYPYHVSFFAVADHGSLEVDVPLNFIGTPKGVRESGGSFDPSMASLHVKCIAAQIPESIDIDVSNLGSGESLTVNQIALPPGVEAQDDGDRVVATVLSGKGGGTAEDEAAS